jgi:hypothetical protein
MFQAIGRSAIQLDDRDEGESFPVTGSLTESALSSGLMFDTTMPVIINASETIDSSERASSF